MKSKFCLVCLGSLLFFCCQTRKVDEQLTKVDTLILEEKYDTAFQVLNAIDTSCLKQEDIAHFTLLKVQTAYLVNKPVESADSLLDTVIDYYQHDDDGDKLIDAYYYKAIGYNLQKDYKKSVFVLKKAESLAERSSNKRLQYKVFEVLSFVNRMVSNYDLQLLYAKKALGLALDLENKNWIGYSYYWMNCAYFFVGKEDSAMYYLNKIPHYIEYVDKNSKPVLLASLGYLLMEKNPEKAKKLLNESLSYQELSATYAYLADISYEEGNHNQAYNYWKKALTIQDPSPKDNIIRNLIEYDLEQGKTDSISEWVTEIFAIRDSIDRQLMNDTIKDLQTRYDHEVVLHEKDQTLARWQLGIFLLIIVMLVFFGYYRRKKYLSKIKLKNYQMQIHDYLSQIEELKTSGEDAFQKIDELNKRIQEIMDKKSSCLLRGRKLYDDVMKGGKIMNKWKKEDVEYFIEYYTATHYRTVDKLRRVRREENLTDYRLLYLILLEMGKTDEEIRWIMSISKETLRVYRRRTKPLKT